MYVPKHYEESDISVLHSLIESQPLGAWVTHGGEELVVNHIPFLLDPARGPHGILIGHVARANAVWKSFSKSLPSVVIFQGPQTYITPSWLPSKHAHGKAVPTWNYAVVHAYGMPHIVEDGEWLLNHVNQLTDIHEADQALPWKVSDAPEEFTNQLVKAIVGIEIPMEKIVGKWKVSQGRPEADKLGVVAGLLSRDDSQSKQMAALVSQHVSIAKGD